MTSARRRMWLEPAILGALFTAFSAINGLARIRSGTYGDTDASARLAQVNDLLSGQRWFDLRQYRLGLDGVEMHWSRVLDAFLAAPVVALRPVVGEPTALVVSQVVVPGLLLVAALYLVALIAERLAGDAARLPAMLLAIFVPFTVTRLAPGSIDHHGLQAVLLLAMLAGLVARSTRWAMIGGVAAGLSLTVGLETLPIVVVALIVIGIGWLSGTPAVAGLRPFALSFLVAMPLAAVMFAPVDRLIGRSCDVLSLPFAVPVAIALATYSLVLRWMPTAHVRWMVLGSAGLLAGIAFLSLAPECASGPYASLPDAAVDVWLRYVAEVQPISLSGSNAASHIAIMLTPATGLLVSAVWLQRDRSWEWLLISATLVAAVGIAFWQQRGAGTAQMAAAPVVGAGLCWLVQAVETPRWRPLVTVVLPFVLSGSWLLALGQRPAQTTATAGVEATCSSTRFVDEIASMDVSVIATDVDFGARLLANTEHQVIAAPYHRDYQGILLTHSILTKPPAESEDLVRASGVDTIIDCRAAPLLEIWLVPGSLLTELRAGNIPGWLTPVLDVGGAVVYKVVP